MGRFDDAIAAEKKALELDPLNPFLNTDLAFFLYWARRFDEATTQIRKTLELDPNNAFAHSILGWCLIAKGNKAEARAEFQKATSLDDLPWYVSSLGYACAATGIVLRQNKYFRIWKSYRSSDMSHPRTGRRFI